MCSPDSDTGPMRPRRLEAAAQAAPVDEHAIEEHAFAEHRPATQAEHVVEPARDDGAADLQAGQRRGAAGQRGTTTTRPASGGRPPRVCAVRALSPSWRKYPAWYVTPAARQASVRHHAQIAARRQLPAGQRAVDEIEIGAAGERVAAERHLELAGRAARRRGRRGSWRTASRSGSSASPNSRDTSNSSRLKSVPSTWRRRVCHPGSGSTVSRDRATATARCRRPGRGTPSRRTAVAASAGRCRPGAGPIAADCRRAAAGTASAVAAGTDRAPRRRSDTRTPHRATVAAARACMRVIRAITCPGRRRSPATRQGEQARVGRARRQELVVRAAGGDRAALEHGHRPARAAPWRAGGRW